jgi:hypothetical protein
MELLKRYKWLLGGAVAVAVLVGFLLFRPDKLFVDDRVDESLSDAFPVATTVTTTATPTTTAVTEVEEPAVDSTTTPPPTTTTTPVVPEPAVATTGQFEGYAHPAAGTAAVYQQDGAFVLRFEDDTEIFNGPDLYVYLLAADDYEDGDPRDYVDLGKLKGNVGGQNYELPADYDPAVDRYVLVWCRRFAVPFAGAPLP